MRTYPSDSPEAAARIVALAMFADGHVSRSEMASLEAMQTSARLTLPIENLHAVLRGLAEDLMSGGCSDWAASCQMEAHTLNALLEEVTDPQLRASTLALCSQLSQADAHCSPAERLFLMRLTNRWSAPADRPL